MSIDTAAITAAVEDFMNQVFQWLPIGVAIVGVPAAIGAGIAFGGTIISKVRGALGSGK